MSINNVEIPYGAYWSTPFTKWQGSLQYLHSMKFAAHVAKQELAKREIDPLIFDSGVLGMTINQYQSFNGAPWALYDIGAIRTPGHAVNQVCATSARALFAASSEVMCGMAKVSLLMSADRCSNGPQIYYPNPKGMGGYGQSEAQVTYNMMNDPMGGHSMMQTGENVAKRFDITREELDAVTLRRYEQYQEALKDDQAFQKRFMTLPLSVPTANFKKEETVLTGDEGVFPTTAEGLAKLKPIMEGGVITFGNQTHPADGNAAIIICHSDQAQALSTRPEIKVEVLGFGQARDDLAYMPAAPIEAAQRALKMANLDIQQIDAIKTHNPFAVNDVALAKALNIDVMTMNNYGCSLIWGHPQGPTGLRAIIEMIEELAIRGGGYGLFTGCAAGDTGMAAIIKVSER
ncbi:Acetyl-CoA acetyltransferase [Marinomonas spartinae]|uniref:Acetyl-CoA acetyltransferase n=1 Tax=Marinomonas spartinae TaxID=1792290 RepID=A0A1A8TNH4_9GAMM|nr:thiolase family protein [Marinomonas spartinae]SBS35371.1 Acetyl-CoA acetyltransferase [Marinomonas spartinae]